jgi:hypothetical protein
MPGYHAVPALAIPFPPALSRSEAQQRLDFLAGHPDHIHAGGIFYVSDGRSGEIPRVTQTSFFDLEQYML